LSFNLQQSEAIQLSTERSDSTFNPEAMLRGLSQLCCGAERSDSTFNKRSDSTFQSRSSCFTGLSQQCNQQPTTNNQNSTTNNQQPTTNNQNQNQQPTTNNPLILSTERSDSSANFS
jgi:hypothetical protein